MKIKEIIRVNSFKTLTVSTPAMNSNNFVSVVKRPLNNKNNVVLFSIVADEIYFLPFFLKHYRALGVQEFWFLVDRSNDGTLEYLMAQPDCGIFQSSLKFGDKIKIQKGSCVQEVNFGTFAKYIIPFNHFQNRWVLTVDADEFLFIPSPSNDVEQLTKRLERYKLDSCRALMIDFFPDALNKIDESPANKSPFHINPNYDVLTVDWPDKKVVPDNISIKKSVRPRMLYQLINQHPEHLLVSKQYG